MRINKRQISDTLSSSTYNVQENFLKELFHLLGLRIKEYDMNFKTVSFEIHYRTTYVIAVDADTSKCLSFSNEYINFSDDVDGITMPIKNVKELILIVLNFFMPKLNIRYAGVSFNEKNYDYEKREFIELIEFCNTEIFKNDAKN